MKEKTLQENKLDNAHQVNFSTNDEINLTDLALILIRRKTLVLIIFISVLVASIIFSVLTPRAYTYSTTIEVGSQIINGSLKPLESAHTLVAKIEYNYIPLILNQLKQSDSKNKTIYRVKSSVLKSSNIALLEIKGTEAESETLIAILEKASQQAVQDHTRIYQSIKSSLEAQLKQRTADLKFLKKSNNNETEIISNRAHIEALSLQLANLRNTKQIQTPIRSIEPTSISKTLTIIISAFAGILLGIFIAFVTEFVVKIKKNNNP